jgi:hypothetical protein
MVGGTHIQYTVGRFNPTFATRDEKQTMIDLRGISSNWFKTWFVAPKGFLGYGLWLAQVVLDGSVRYEYQSRLQFLSV